MRYFSLLVLFFAFGFFANAQSYFTISGSVLNAETGNAMQSASVFAQNTTYGTVTDENGNFKLSLPNGGYDLVVTFAGMQTESKRISTGDANQKMYFKLSAKTQEMDAVAIVASPIVKNGWEKYGKKFNSEFVGESKNAEQTSIKNPQDLKFYYSKKRNRLKVLSDSVIVLENKRLGYIIHYTLDSLAIDLATDESIYTGFPLFEEMKSEDPQEMDNWKKARELTYDGSTLQLMRGIFNQSLLKDGFEIQFLLQLNGKDSSFVLKNPYNSLRWKKDDSTGIVSVMPFQPRVGVIYFKKGPPQLYLNEYPDEPKKFQFSQLLFKENEAIFIEPNGYFFDQFDISYSGYLGWNKVADMLPFNYLMPDPVVENPSVILDTIPANPQSEIITDSIPPTNSSTEKVSN